MTTTTLFAQANPGTTTSGAGNNGTNGLHFTVSSACTLDGIWHYSPSGATQLPTSIGLYTVTTLGTSGTLVHSETVSSWSGAAGSGWVFASFASPPSLSSGVQYMAVQFRNDATSRWFDFYAVTWPVTSGIITAPKDESTSALSQGWYNIGTAMAFPVTQSGTAGSNFGMDVQVSTGTSHTATASLTVTPSFSAAAARTHPRAASLTVTPSFSATGQRIRNRTASLTVIPAFSAAAQRTRNRAASLTVTPSFSATWTPARNRTASLTVTPVLSAAKSGTRFRSAALTVTPSFSAAPHASRVRTASLTVAPVLAAAAVRAAGAQPGYPGGLVGAQAEFYMGGSWVNVTADALPDGRQSGTITGGQPDGAQQPAPASMAMTLDNPGYAYSPRNSSGPYYGQLRQNTPARVSLASVLGTRLRLENDSSDMASVADTSALHVTGSMEIRFGVILSDWRAATLCARNDGTVPSWSVILNSNGTVSFWWYDSGGTIHHVDSPAAAGVSWQAFRVTFDAANGNVQFFLSGDIDGTWTPMGAAASGTSGAATSIRAGNSPLTVGWSATAATQMRGTVTAFRMYNGLSGAGGTVIADAGFAAQLPGTVSWTDTAGRNWTLSGGAEISARDYRLYAELSSLNPAAAPSGAAPQLQAVLSGRLRRLQQASAPTVESAIRRAILSQAGSLYPVAYWPMEETQAAKMFGPAVGSQLMAAELGKVQAAADSSFEASAPLPVLQGDQLSFTVDSYSGATAWAVRFLFKRGATLPASGSVRLIEINTTGTVTKLQVVVNPDGTLTFKGFLSGGSAAWTEAAEEAFPQTGGPGWWSVEATQSGGNVTYALVALAPGAASGNTDAHAVAGSFGNVTGGTVNPDLVLTDTVFGHLSVQKAWASMFTLGPPLNAWRTELAADRFARVCAEQGIPCRILGRPATTQAMGPQPRGSAWTILKDCMNTEQGIVFEPRDCFGLGLRTRESMGAQSAGVTLSFAAANLQGDLQPADDDQGFLNDVTGAMPDGTSWREVLDDGSVKSVSEPKDGGMGRYAGAVPFSMNVADASELGSNVAFYLGRTSVNEARYRNVVMDLGIPGAPAADIARLRPGDLVSVPSPPGIYQTADIGQLAMGWRETFGPGRKITWNGVPFSPYGGAPAGPVAAAVLDTEGGGVLDTSGGQILGTGA